jgi:arsenite-transporting ATPase
VHVDLWFERQLFSSLLDSVPPGLDEVMAVFRILDLISGKKERVVIDMAPTGHALELLRTPERILAWTRLLLKTLAPHRTLSLVQDAAVKIAELGRRVRELVEVLRNSEATGLYAVMLAEALPDRETERLLSGLGSLQISPDALFINRVIFRKDAGRCARCRRARCWQMAIIGKLHCRPGKTYVIRNFPAEIAGKRALRSFTGELWQLV